MCLVTVMIASERTISSENRGYRNLTHVAL